MAARTPLRVEDVDVIAPNFKRRLSGVTSTIVQLVPLQAAMGLRIATLGPGLPGHLPFIRLRDVWRLWKRPRNHAFRVWHARRNIEMVGGLVLRDVLRMPLKLVFTSAAQRRHKPFTRFLISRMDTIIASSRKSAAFLHVPYTMIMHSVNVAAFQPSGHTRSAVRQQFNLGAEQKLAGCFGRVRHQKGTDLFVEAMITLLPSSPGWSAIISGRITSEHEAFAAGLRARIKEAGLEGRIVFAGEVPDILLLYQAIDLYVAPSRNEGFGLTPLEAMACGVPVVTSDAGAYTDMVQPGVNGEICAAADAAELTWAIAKMLAPTTELGAMGRNALAFVRQNFAQEKEAESLNAVYAQLIDGQAWP